MTPIATPPCHDACRRSSTGNNGARPQTAPQRPLPRRPIVPIVETRPSGPFAGAAKPGSSISTAAQGLSGRAYPNHYPHSARQHPA